MLLLNCTTAVLLSTVHVHFSCYDQKMILGIEICVYIATHAIPDKRKGT